MPAPGMNAMYPFICMLQPTMRHVGTTMATKAMTTAIAIIKRRLSERRNNRPPARNSVDSAFRVQLPCLVYRLSIPRPEPNLTLL